MAMSRRWKNRSRRAAPGFWIGLILAGIVAWRLWGLADSQPPPPLAPATQVFVLRAVDGDTLLLEDGRRVRLLGVDTPETKREGTPIQPWGPEAHAFTAGLVEGRTVRLEFDRERHDKYDRVLAYVYANDQLVNEELLREGLARGLYKFPYSEAMKRRFRAAEREARDARRGIWSEGGAERRRQELPEREPEPVTR